MYQSPKKKNNKVLKKLIEKKPEPDGKKNFKLPLKSSKQKKTEVQPSSLNPLPFWPGSVQRRLLRRRPILLRRRSLPLSFGASGTEKAACEAESEVGKGDWNCAFRIYSAEQNRIFLEFYLKNKKIKK